MKLKHNYLLNKGFTLLEVLVSVAIIGILITVASAVFINTIRSANKANVTVEARENGSNVIETFDKDIRQATNIDSSGAPSTIIVTTVGGVITWSCTAPSGSTPGFIGRQIGAGAALPITNKSPQNGVSVSSCGFDVAYSTNSSLVKIKFTVSQPSGINSSDFSVNLPFDHSVATRSF